jgi:glucose-1-phosphate thymidylyltransferase
MWGIVPAAGVGSRIQPLAFSKELLPVGSRREGDHERPRAVSEYLLERMALAGVSRICFVISPEKSDILQYFGDCYGNARIAYVVQPKPAGLCDAIFKALPLVSDDEWAIIGLPDTIWFPAEGLTLLGRGALELLLFPVTRPDLFDAVITGEGDRVLEIDVKKRGARSNWIWGAFKVCGRTLRELEALWQKRDRTDVYVGSLFNAWIAGGGKARASRAGETYVDVGTLHGYREAIRLLDGTSDGGVVAR